MNLEEIRQKLAIGKKVIFLTGSHVTKVKVIKILGTTTEEAEKGVLCVVEGEFINQNLIRGDARKSLCVSRH